MLVSCRYCNGLHNRGVICQKKPINNSRKKEETYISRFRSLNIWKKKRLEIKTRDKFLCQYCLSKNIYTFNKLEVHHITSISKNWKKRLDNFNLITLCSSCHKMAETGEIKKRVLVDLVQKNENAF